MARTGKDPLGPIVFVMSVLSGLFGMLLVLVLIATFTGQGSFLGIGEPYVCVTVPHGATHEAQGGSDPVQVRLPKGQTLFQSTGEDYQRITRLAPGVSVRADSYQLCDTSPSGIVRAYSALTTWPDFVVFLGFVLLIWSVIRRAGRRGIFSTEVASRILLLGWWLLVGTLLVSAASAFGKVGLLHELNGQGTDQLLTVLHLSVPTLIAGFGLITLGRVMAQTVPMREELDATV